MSAITLPALPLRTLYTPRPVRFGNDLTPDHGGRSDRLTRMGDRWAVVVRLPPMRYVDAMPLLSALNRAAGRTVLMPWPQPGLTLRGRPGTILVKGGGQAGESLDVDGGNPNFLVKDGQFFSIKHALGEGEHQRFLHQSTADVRIDAAGEATLAFTPMLRRSPSDNAAIELQPAMIEGFLAIEGDPWDLGEVDDVEIQFTVTERE